MSLPALLDKIVDTREASSYERLSYAAGLLMGITAISKGPKLGNNLIDMSFGHEINLDEVPVDLLPVPVEQCEDEKSQSKPFQLHASQFDGDYDIKAYKEEITEYANACLAQDITPVIEIRWYDVALYSSVEKFTEKARRSLKEIGLNSPFEITIKQGRDSCMEPMMSRDKMKKRRLIKKDTFRLCRKY